MTEQFERLARMRGLGEAYYDYRGNLQHFSDDARRAILQAMNVAVDSEQSIAAALTTLTQQESTTVSTATTDAPCYQPFARDNKRCWGLSIQLYTLRSANNWGIGDFADLRELIHLAAPFGCDLIGMNPLHATLLAAPEHFSPYSPSSRLFLNVMYIAVHEVEHFDNQTIHKWFNSKEVQQELSSLRASSNVLYAQVVALKFNALQKLFSIWLKEGAKKQFQIFIDEQGELLRMHAVFDALDRHFRTQSSPLYGWQQWPEEFRNPHSGAVRKFADMHQQEVEFYQYLQWLAATQLQQAQQLAKESGMRIGLYGDLAVGASPDGSEVWSNQSLYLTRVTVGAPPDPMALNGQDWGIPPMDPQIIKAQAYKPIIDLFRANMRYVGALRIDHVMSLFRLWWVPRGFLSTHGVYVHYPLESICGLLAAESNRRQCVVIGEDLGVVPDEIRKAMAERYLLHYKVLLFEKDGARFKSPDEYVGQSVATATTHDLPSLKAWWQSDDLELRERLKLYASSEVPLQLRREREVDRRALLIALTQAQLWQWQAEQELPPFSDTLAQAMHRYLAMSSSALVLLQLEDLIGMTEPVNVPGTYLEHANWQRKITMSLNGIFALESVRQTFNVVQQIRS
jgi:4-alpha-glucanotransferase